MNLQTARELGLPLGRRAEVRGVGVSMEAYWTGIRSAKASEQNIPLDAIPDLSDVQVIVYTEWPGQAAQIVQDQVTYPITTKMPSVPKAKVVRGYSFYGFS